MLRTSALLVVSATLVLAMATVSGAQSLADVAKKEKQRQAKVKAQGGASKVYTEGIKGKSGGTSDETARPTGAGSESSAEAELPPPRPASVSASAARHANDARRFRTVSITMYVTSWCPYCKRARAYLSSQENLRVTIYDIEENKARHSEMLAKTGGQKGVPVIDVEGLILQGFSAEAIEEAIDSIRYR